MFFCLQFSILYFSSGGWNLLSTHAICFGTREVEIIYLWTLFHSDSWILGDVAVALLVSYGQAEGKTSIFWTGWNYSKIVYWHILYWCNWNELYHEASGPIPCAWITLQNNIFSICDSSKILTFTLFPLSSNSTTVFSHAQTVVMCGSCSVMLCQPTGGRARLTEGCSYRKKVD